MRYHYLGSTGLRVSELDQLRINLGSVDVELSNAQMSRLTAVSDVTSDYPYDSMIAEAKTDR